MKAVFAGPSLHGVKTDLSGLDVRGPAEQGDIIRAVNDGASVIGLIDGVFGSARSVWHKEILQALSEGVRVLGAASMGALRAAECAEYGMEPIGQIANAYCRGQIDDDAAVALVFGPRELGYPPLSEPLVDVEDKVAWLAQKGLMTGDEAKSVQSAAQNLFYADRSIPAIFDAAFPGSPARRAQLVDAYKAINPSAKQRDALECIAAMHGQRAEPPVPFVMRYTPFWRPGQAEGRQPT